MTTSQEIHDPHQFRNFMLRLGFDEEDVIGEYEINRYRLHSREGTNPPVIVYRKKNYPIFTVYKNGNEFEYLEDEVHRLLTKGPTRQTSLSNEENTPF